MSQDDVQQSHAYKGSSLAGEQVPRKSESKPSSSSSQRTIRRAIDSIVRVSERYNTISDNRRGMLDEIRIWSGVLNRGARVDG